jgi:hypothetical protein
MLGEGTEVPNTKCPACGSIETAMIQTAHRITAQRRSCGVTWGEYRGLDERWRMIDVKRGREDKEVLAG